MNLVDATIIKVIGSPYSKYGKWFVDVKVEAYGAESLTSEMFSTKVLADKLKVGDTVQI